MKRSNLRRLPPSLLLLPAAALIFLSCARAAQETDTATNTDANTDTVHKVIEPLPHYAHITRTVGWILPNVHLLQHPLDDAISARAWTNYLAMLDYDRVYFLQSDIDEFEASRDTLDDAVRAGDLTFAYGVFERFKQRMDERVAYVDDLLEQGFDYTIPESYTWKRKEAPWSATPEEQNELWRLRIKNECLGFRIARDYGESNKLARAAALATNNAARAHGVVTNSAALTEGLPATNAITRTEDAVTNGVPPLTP